MSKIVMDEIVIPVLKAWKRIFEILECAYNHPFDRVGFQDAILELFPGKAEKSVFRGMTIPTLRSLGFIVGFDNYIRVGANGALLHIANQNSTEEGLRVLRALLLEIDKSIGIIDYIENINIVLIEDLVNAWIDKVSITDPRTRDKPESKRRGAKERINDWINFLSFSGLLDKDRDNVQIDKTSLIKTEKDLEIQETKTQIFSEEIIKSYLFIVAEQKGIKTVNIEKLREKLGTSIYKKCSMLITGSQFDSLMRDLDKNSEDYTITFGRSMGADEKLFYYHGKYFQTINIRFYSGLEEI